MNDLISRESAIDSIYKNHMNGKEGVKQDVENLPGVRRKNDKGG